MPQEPPVVELLEGLVALALPLARYLKDLGGWAVGKRETYCYSGPPKR